MFWEWFLWGKIKEYFSWKKIQSPTSPNNWEKEKIQVSASSAITDIDVIPSISEPNSVVIETIWVSEVSSDLQKKVNTIIDAGDIGKIRYFLMELIRKNTGIIAPTVTLNSSKDKISVKIPGKFKSEASVPRMLIREGMDGKKWKIIDTNILGIGNFKISLDAYFNSGWFDIEIIGKIRDSDLETLKDFFERVFLNEYMVNEQSSYSSSTIHAMLELTDRDLIIFDEKLLEITIALENEITLDESVFGNIAIKLNNSESEFSIKTKKTYLGGDTIGTVFYIQDIKKQFSYTIKVEIIDWKMIISMIDIYSGIQLDRIFIENILRKIIFYIKNSTNTKKSALQWLRSMGVMVYEKNPDDQKKTLDELYKEDGFVGYEDIKATLAENIINPWENREKYMSIAADRFSHIQNIIPNTALFEWPPGTGKTTQAKIIWKYLGYPFIYIPIAKLMSKWYGESEWRLDTIFELAWKAAKENGGIIVMIDEIDEIGRNRDDSHEATGRMTGVLLKKLDGMEQIPNILLIGSTNRKDSMDEALLSRFGQQIYFRLPVLPEIHHIFSFYIPEFSEIPTEKFSHFIGKSGRDISNIAKDIARKYLQMHIVQNNTSVDMKTLLEDYLRDWDTTTQEKIETK
jgi:AAA+ superfamily predicted ATPase